MNEKIRHKAFTSSEIYRLCGSVKSGAPTSSFKTYAEEVKIARFLGREPKTKVNTRPMRWGSLMECVLFDMLGLNYSMEHKKSIVHERYYFWAGTPDLLTDKKVGEIKCYEPLHFGKAVLALQTKDPEKIKELEPQMYWQVVSNSILTKKEYAELLLYMPYKDELFEIIDMVENTNFLERNGLDPLDYYFLTKENIEALSYLPNDSEVKNLNKFEFKVPKKDIWFLTKRVLEAEKLINPHYEYVVEVLSDGTEIPVFINNQQVLSFKDWCIIFRYTKLPNNKFTKRGVKYSEKALRNIFKTEYLQKVNIKDGL